MTASGPLLFAGSLRLFFLFGSPKIRPPIRISLITSEESFNVCTRLNVVIELPHLPRLAALLLSQYYIQIGKTKDRTKKKNEGGIWKEKINK